MPKAENSSYEEVFIWSVALILFVTGMVKLITADAASISALRVTHPLFGMSHQKVYLLLGTLELGLVACLLSCGNVDTKLYAAACFGTAGMFYHVVVAGFDVEAGSCPCLGDLFVWLHLSGGLATRVAQVLLAYILVGASALIHRRVAKRRAASGELSESPAGSRAPR